MPSASPHDAVNRQWHLLDLLPSTPPGRTVVELTQSLASEGFDVHRRTVERDLAALALRFPIVSTEAKPCGWHWLSRKAFDTLGLSMSDAFTLQMLERYLPVLPGATTKQLKPVFELAKNKLDVHAESNGIARWANLIAVQPAGIPVIPPEIDESVQETVQAALFDRKKLKIRYTKVGGDTAKQHLVSPVGLVLSGEKTYLVATNAHHSKPATYALHRIDWAERTWEPADVPEIPLQHFIDEGGIQFFSKGPIELKAWISKELGFQLSETKLSEDQSLMPVADGFDLTVTLPDSLRLRQWVLSWTGDIEVREPAALREQIAEQLREGAARYS